MYLETARLIIREFNAADIDELAPILGDPEVMKYSLKGPLSRGGAQEYLDQIILAPYREHGYGMWALISKESHKLIGLAGPIHQVVDGQECVEIGYRIASSEWGKGFATEALLAIRDYAFAHFKLDKLIAIIEPSNTRSVAVAKKAGFRLSKMSDFHGFHVGIYEVHRLEVAPYSKERDHP